jgi:ribosomal protein L37AE/L43A
VKRPPHSGICEPICQWCADNAAADIAALPADYVDLKQDLERRCGMSETKIARPNPTSVEPIDLFVDELCADIAWTLTVWEIPVREAARLAPEARQVRPGVAVAAAAALLSTHIEVLAALPATVGYADGLAAGPVLRSGRDGIDALRKLHARARTRLGITLRVFRLPGDCSRCGRWALRRLDGSNTVWCDNCRQTWTYDDYCKYVNLTTASLGPA